MYRRYKERFGTAGVVLGVIAIVLAIGGSAIAASGLTGKQKKEVKAIAKSFQGTGPAGPAGTAGTNGTNGTNGVAGKDGVNGSAGSNGKNVAVSSSAPGCAEGGVTVQVAGEPSTAKEVCNGEAGAPGNTGPTGDPWTAGGTLPVGSTEAGTWSVLSTVASAPKFFGFLSIANASISFGIPLGAAPAGHLIGSGGNEIGGPNNGNPQPACDDGTGTPPSYQNPEADSGHLCLFIPGSITGGAFEEITTVGSASRTVGAQVLFEVSGDLILTGSWAVTG